MSHMNAELLRKGYDDHETICLNCSTRFLVHAIGPLKLLKPDSKGVKEQQGEGRKQCRCCCRWQNCHLYATGKPRSNADFAEARSSKQCEQCCAKCVLRSVWETDSIVPCYSGSRDPLSQVKTLAPHDVEAFSREVATRSTGP